MKKKLIAVIIALLIIASLIGWWIGPYSKKSETSNENQGLTETPSESQEIIEIDLSDLIDLGCHACEMETLFRDAPVFASEYVRRASEEFLKLEGKVIRTTGFVEDWGKPDEFGLNYPFRIDLSYRIEVYGVNKPGGFLYLFVPQGLLQKVQDLNLRWLDQITIEGKVLGYTKPYIEVPAGSHVTIELTKIVEVKRR